ncbi:recombinase family protein [Zavarzinella formosa]|uniref:recombinase family protein n=1 Tax=Zavarzinella formosa TaxID=360055 RepID=UPI0002EE224C|nr:recombinase family protein [Zavarzinella formosa]
MSGQKSVVYCRTSSDMQRPESCDDQEREVLAGLVRAGLIRAGVSGDDIVVIHDEAESGTKTERDGFRRLCNMINRGEVAILAVDDQSRLTRAANAFAFIQDLVFAGGRFLSTGEGIDTDTPGWELKVQVLQLHHGQTVRDLRHRVRRGQHGRVEADGSAGDFPYGFESYYLDPDWAAQLKRRGPKPKKGLRVCEEEAVWVRRVFEWFVAGTSIGLIARRLTAEKVAKGRRASAPGWHPQQVRRMLANEKYIGKWAWGRTETIRDSKGRKKQTAATADRRITRERPSLRIIGQELWDRAAARLASLGEKFGYQPGQRRRGPLPNPADDHPKSPLGGTLVCGVCGAKMWLRQSNGRRYYACPGAMKGLCDMTTRAPADRAERALSEFLVDLLRGWPEWMQTLYRLTCDAIRAAAEQAPAERERDMRKAAELERQIHNLVSVLADGGAASPAITARLREAEMEKAEIDRRLDKPGRNDPAKIFLPDESWVAERLGEWAGQIPHEGPGGILRLALASARAEPVITPGKKRGFVRLRFRLNAWRALAAALGDALPVESCGLWPKPSAGGDDGPEFMIDLGEPTAMDRWAPQIVAWRAEGVTWEEITRRTGLDLNRAFIAWKRLQGADEAPPAA